MRKYIVPDAKRIGAKLLEIMAPEIAEIVSGRKKFKTAAKSVGDRLWEDSWVVVAGKKLPAKSFQENLQNKSVGREETFLQTFLINHFKYILIPTFVAVSGNLGGKVPVVDDVLSSHDKKNFPTPSLDENCIEFEFQTERNYYVDLRTTSLALKLKLSGVVVTKFKIAKK